MFVKNLHFFLVVLFASLLVACSPRSSSETQASPSPAVQDVPTSLPPTATTEPAQAPVALTLLDGLGRQVTIQVPAKRIVSLAPSTTEMLFAVGAGAQVVGRDSFSDYPEEAKALPDIGGGFSQFNNEAIVALQPDLVLAAATISPDQVQALQDLDIVVYLVPNPLDFAGLYLNLDFVGQITGHTDESAQLVQELQARVSAVEAAIAPLSDPPLVFYELDATDPNAPWTAGSGTFVNMLIEMSGGTNLGAVLEGEWAQVSIEVLLQQQPDVIVLGDATWGGVTPQAVAAREGWQNLDAVRSNQVFVFDDNLISRPGPRLVDGLEAMARLLHPDAFN